MRKLTNRQREVLILSARGWEHKEIANILGNKPKTVRVHSADVMFRLGACNMKHAVALALSNGLITVDDVITDLPVARSRITY